MSISSQRSPISRSPSTSSWCGSNLAESFVSFAIVTDWSPIRSRWIEIVQDGQHEPEIACDGRLEREHLLDHLLDPVIALVDLVVEGDHLVAELDVLGRERVDRSANGAQAEGALLLEAGLEDVEALLVLDPHG